MNNKSPFSAFCLAGTNSGGGKTTVTLAILGALKRRGLRVAPFKCGPDYIDAAYQSRAVGRESVNLDTWMMGCDGVSRSFSRNSQNADVSVVEGVMGLFDGISPKSIEASTADCAAVLGIPVILVVNARGIAGSISAMVSGFANFSSKIRIAGVIANNVGSDSHAKLLRESLESNDLPPLLGCLPHNIEWEVPERHLGLMPIFENCKENDWFESLADAAEKHMDIGKILDLCSLERTKIEQKRYPPASCRVGLAMDEAFNFYYHDNMHHLRMAGLEMVRFSLLSDSKLPENIDWLYIGGGFPELFAEGLSKNNKMISEIRKFAEGGKAIYAECGGMMYLCESLRNSQGAEFPMCSVLPAKTFMGNRLRSLGYREVKTLESLPFCGKGVKIRGHEFHWSDIEASEPLPPLFLARDSRGNIFNAGVKHGNIAASYIHLHFESIPLRLFSHF